MGKPGELTNPSIVLVRAAESLSIAAAIDGVIVCETVTRIFGSIFSISSRWTRHSTENTFAAAGVSDLEALPPGVSSLQEVPAGVSSLQELPAGVSDWDELPAGSSWLEGIVADLEERVADRFDRVPENACGGGRGWELPSRHRSLPSGSCCIPLFEGATTFAFRSTFAFSCNRWNASTCTSLIGRLAGVSLFSIDISIRQDRLDKVDVVEDDWREAGSVSQSYIIIRPVYIYLFIPITALIDTRLRIRIHLSCVSFTANNSTGSLQWPTSAPHSRALHAARAQCISIEQHVLQEELMKRQEEESMSLIRHKRTMETMSEATNYLLAQDATSTGRRFAEKLIENVVSEVLVAFPPPCRIPTAACYVTGTRRLFVLRAMRNTSNWCHPSRPSSHRWPPIQLYPISSTLHCPIGGEISNCCCASSKGGSFTTPDPSNGLSKLQPFCFTSYSSCLPAQSKPTALFASWMDLVEVGSKWLLQEKNCRRMMLSL